MGKSSGGIPKEAKALVTELYKSGITDLSILSTESGLDVEQVKSIVAQIDKKMRKDIPEGEATATVDESEHLLNIINQAAPSNKRKKAAIDIFMRLGDLDNLGYLRYALELAGFKPNEQDMIILLWAKHRGLPIPKDIKERIERFKVELPEEHKKEDEDEDEVDKLIDMKRKKLEKLLKYKELEEMEKLFAPKNDEKKDEKPKKKKRVPLIGPDGEVMTDPYGRPLVIEADDPMSMFIIMQMMNAQKNKKDDDEMMSQVMQHDPRIDMLERRISSIERSIERLVNVITESKQREQEDKESKESQMINIMMQKINELENKLVESQYQRMLEEQKAMYEQKISELQNMLNELKNKIEESNKEDPKYQQLMNAFAALQNEIKSLREENMKLKEEKQMQEIEARFAKLESYIGAMAKALSEQQTPQSEVGIVAQTQKELINTIASEIRNTLTQIGQPIASAYVNNQRLNMIMSLAALEQQLGYPKGALVKAVMSASPVDQVVESAKNIENPDVKKKVNKALANVLGA